MAPDSDRDHASKPRSAFPPDLVRCITEHLNDSPTLASLCLVDRQSFILVRPLLYNTVRLATPHSILAFCNSVLHSGHNLGRYPRSIYFDPHYPEDEQLIPLVETICQTLKHTRYLTDLSIRINTPNILAFYQQHQAPFPFSLWRFACYLPSKPHFAIPFFSTQPSIRSLTIYESEPIQYPMSHTSYIRTVPIDVLPNLTSVCANSLTISALVPGRPISHVDSGIMVLFGGTAHLFCEALKLSTAPGGIQSVAAFIPQTRYWTAMLDLINKLGGICATSLKELKLTMPKLSVSEFKFDDYVGFIELLPVSLNIFTQLEYFQFSDMQTEIITPGILNSELCSAGALKFWTGEVPTLKNVILCGVNLK